MRFLDVNVAHCNTDFSEESAVPSFQKKETNPLRNIDTSVTERPHILL
jgi:hypothetical protein